MAAFRRSVFDCFCTWRRPDGTKACFRWSAIDRRHDRAVEAQCYGPTPLDVSGLGVPAARSRTSRAVVTGLAIVAPRHEGMPGQACDFRSSKWSPEQPFVPGTLRKKR